MPFSKERGNLGNGGVKSLVVLNSYSGLCSELRERGRERRETEREDEEQPPPALSVLLSPTLSF